MPLKVIGAGLPRTGTNSLKHALNQLGFGPCAHADEWIANPRYASRRTLWERFYDGGAPDWEALLAGFNSAVDWPVSACYRRLAEAYPEAKLVLTTREPQGWLRSMLQASNDTQAWRQVDPRAEESLGKLLSMVARETGRAHPLPGTPSYETEAVEYFAWYTEAAKRAISAERLLVFDVREGWAPLCEFLGVPVPETPFPHTNSGAEFAEFHRKLVEDARSPDSD